MRYIYLAAAIVLRNKRFRDLLPQATRKRMPRFYTQRKIKLPPRAFVGACRQAGRQVVTNKLKLASRACWSQDTTRAVY